ncbi:hypothetical protein BJL95_03675 [Methylomonas sp. LWB]|uniref:hypothetical protein n=1 Tax=Methylomonas sp. LWB TaxID=1905845 RepID=UPI0008D96E20|nr:hypothetical protein [Methylomonas sp. LWB]OHX34252.1 hypothetical protein BJL95_03675 [Methylomonas sp. LWB]
MPLVRKTAINRHLEELDKRYNELREALVGNDPSTSLWNFYALSEDDFLRDYTTINRDRLEYALNDFKTVLSVLNKFKAHKEQKLHSVK